MAHGNVYLMLQQNIRNSKRLAVNQGTGGTENKNVGAMVVGWEIVEVSGRGTKVFDQCKLVSNDPECGIGSLAGPVTVHIGMFDEMYGECPP